MTIEAYPFENSNISTEVQWQRMARLWMPDGVDTVPSGGSLKVTHSAGLTVSIAEGHAILRGIFYRQVGAITRSCVVNGSTFPRLDRVVLRCDLGANTIEPLVITGTPAATPTAPAMSYTETVFDLPLATVRVEANDTIAAGGVSDKRRYVGRPVVYCTSDNRPDPQGRPMLAFETDKDRVIYTDGTSGTWIVGIGNDVFRPIYAYSGDNGTTTRTTWDTTLDNTGTTTVSATFTAPPSGRAMIRIGANLATNTSNAIVYMAVRVRSAAGTDYWAFNDPAVTAPDRMIYFNASPFSGTGTTGASCAGTFYASTLTPGTVYTATLGYRVSGAGQVGTWDDRWIEIQPLP